jgi:two-component system phosphate regulon sensor histidine kinase PhoR
VNAGKLVALWAGLALCVIAALLWISPNIAAGSHVSVAAKLILVFAVFGLATTGTVLRAARRWSAASEKLENYIASLPSARTDLPDDLPESQELVRAVRDMADRSRHLMDRASREVARRETILACMAEGVLAVDRNLKVIFCNEAFGQAFSTRTPVAEGKTLFEVVREPALRDILERVLRSGTAETERFQLPSAAGRWFIARAVPLGQGEEGDAVIVLHDITDIERQEQVRKDFVADVSHELRTPLAAIRGYAETLLDGALEDSQNNRRFVEIILAHAVRLNNIAADLLVISELDSNVQPAVPPERLSILEIIESAIHTVEHAAALRDIRLNREHCRDCIVIGHRFRLEQALVNLLDNAVKFNRPEGSVVIECDYTAEHQVRISISDTGIGISQEDLKRIFDRFYRADKARTRAAGGTGLGLPIVKQVIERMGGAITVESQLGRGSRFTILLPAFE